MAEEKDLTVEKIVEVLDQHFANNNWEEFKKNAILGWKQISEAVKNKKGD
jgi:hypothetical protein